MPTPVNVPISIFAANLADAMRERNASSDEMAKILGWSTDDLVSVLAGLMVASDNEIDLAADALGVPRKQVRTKGAFLSLLDLPRDVRIAQALLHIQFGCAPKGTTIARMCYREVTTKHPDFPPRQTDQSMGKRGKDHEMYVLRWYLNRVRERQFPMSEVIVEAFSTVLKVPVCVLESTDGPGLQAYRKAARYADSGMESFKEWTKLVREYDKRWSRVDEMAGELSDELREMFTQQYPLSASWAAARANPGFAGGLPWAENTSH